MRLGGDGAQAGSAADSPPAAACHRRKLQTPGALACRSILTHHAARRRRCCLCAAGCLQDLQRFFRHDDPEARPAFFAVSKYNFARSDLVPLITSYPDDYDVVYNARAWGQGWGSTAGLGQAGGGVPAGEERLLRAKRGRASAQGRRRCVFLGCVLAVAVAHPCPSTVPRCAVKVATFLTMPSSEPLVTTNRAAQEAHMQVGTAWQGAWGSSKQQRCGWFSSGGWLGSGCIAAAGCSAPTRAHRGSLARPCRRCARRSWLATRWRRWWACLQSHWGATRAWTSAMLPWCSWSSPF